MVPAAPRHRPAPGLGRAGVFALFAVAVACANPRELGRPFVENFTGREIGGDPGLFAPAQAADGLVAFASKFNVVLFDGRTWERIPITEGYVLAVVPSADGTFLASSADDVGRLAKGRDGRWAFTSLAPNLPADLKPLGYVWTVVEHGGDLFFTTPRHIVRLTGGDPAKSRTWLGSPATRLHRLHGRLHVHDPASGLRLYQNGDFQPWADAAEFRDAKLRVVFEGLGADVWGVHTDGKVFRLDANGRSTPWPHDAGSIIADAVVRAGVTLADGALALCTGTRGVVVIGADRKLRHHLHEGNGLESNIVGTALRDREGGVWVTHPAGTSRLDLDPRVTVFDRTTGFGRTTNILKMLRHRGTVFGVAEDGLFHLLPASAEPGAEARWQRHQPAGANRVRSVASLGNTLLVLRATSLARWTGTDIEDIAALPPAGRRTELEPTPARLLVGTEAGLALFEPAAGTWRYTATVPGFNSAVESLVPAGPASYWIGTLSQGVFRVGFPAAAPASVEKIEPALGLPAGQRLHIDATAAGIIFRGPRAAFFHDSATGRFVPNDRLLIDGQPAAAIERLGTAADGRIFVQARHPGAPERLRLGWFARRDVNSPWTWHALPARLVDRLGMIGARWLFHDNHEGSDILWAAGTGVVLRIDLSRPPAPASRPGVVIRRAERGESLLPAGGDPLPFSAHAVRFAFASPSFSAGNAIRFQTRLLGFDADWTEPSARTEAEFTNLAGGPFTFEVRAIDADRQAGEPARFVFSIARPWHQTAPAFVGYALALVGVVIGFVRWRLGRAGRERRRLEQIVADRTAELAAANRAKSLFLANMSHELRTPLNGIIGYAQILAKASDLSAQNRERVRIVGASGEHLLRMINEVLDFSKIEAGKTELRPAPFHLPQLLQDIAAGFAPRAEAKRLAFTLAADPGLPALVLGDAQKLRQVLDNLLGHAIKFTATGGVTLRVSSGDRRLATGDKTSNHTSSDCLPSPVSGLLTFSVTDTGAGIAPADQGKLFQPFAQAVDGRPPEPGTGLGLAIASRYVALMGGTLTVASEPGRGSEFSFACALDPLALDATAPAPAPRRVLGYAGPRRRILVVDDVEVNRSLLLELLSPLGFDLDDAADGAAALTRAGAARPDAVLLDLRMPGMDGIEVARRLRALPGGAAIKIIAMSASVLSFSRDDAFAAGCDDFLAKPFREEELIDKLGLALRLEWRHAAAPVAPAAVAGGTLPSAGELAPLLTAVRRGEIATVRALLAELQAARPDCAEFLGSADALAREFRMEQLRELLEKAPAPTAAP